MTDSVHRFSAGDARALDWIEPESVGLVVTSPPYPMIAMWDEGFASLDPAVATLLVDEDAAGAFEAMHRILDDVWRELYRLLTPGGFCCINIGDATRSIGGRFQLHPNASRIITGCARLGFDALPRILWRKATNAPNKFMGSGVLPAGAYVTLEHEHVLIFRKGGKRRFTDETERMRRRRSAIFWEERNRWFSDLWTDVGFAGQKMEVGAGRERSAAFPVELAFRLVHMYSLQEDTVLDPFVGTGSTAVAAAAGARNSIGVDLDETLIQRAGRRLADASHEVNTRNMTRLQSHFDFVEHRRQDGKVLKHKNHIYDVPVMTAQETDLQLPRFCECDETADGYRVSHRGLEPDFFL